MMRFRTTRRPRPTNRPTTPVANMAAMVVFEPSVAGEVLVKLGPSGPTTWNVECGTSRPPTCRWPIDRHTWSILSLRLWEAGKLVEAGWDHARRVISSLGWRTANALPDEVWGLNPGYDEVLLLAADLERRGLGRVVLIDLVNGAAVERMEAPHLLGAADPLTPEERENQRLQNIQEAPCTVCGVSFRSHATHARGEPHDWQPFGKLE